MLAREVGDAALRYSKSKLLEEVSKRVATRRWNNPRQSRPQIEGGFEVGAGGPPTSPPPPAKPFTGTAYEPHKVDNGNKTVFVKACTDKAKYPKRVNRCGILFRPSPSPISSPSAITPSSTASTSSLSPKAPPGSASTPPKTIFSQNQSLRASNPSPSKSPAPKAPSPPPTAALTPSSPPRLHRPSSRSHPRRQHPPLGPVRLRLGRPTQRTL